MYSQDYFPTLKTRGNRRVSVPKDMWDRHKGRANQQLRSLSNNDRDDHENI